MSIILNTLERLEAENTAAGGPGDAEPSETAQAKEDASTDSQINLDELVLEVPDIKVQMAAAEAEPVPYIPGAESRSFPYKSILSVALLVTGASLLIWFGADRTGVANDQAVAESIVPSQQHAPGSTQQSSVPQEPGIAATITDERAATDAMLTDNAVSKEPVIEEPTVSESLDVGLAPTTKQAVTQVPDSTTSDNASTASRVAIAKQDPAPELPVALPPAPVHSEPVIEGPNIEDILRQARIALSLGDYQKSLSKLDSLVTPPEFRGDYWLIKGSAHLGLGQLALAEKSFEAAKVLAPENAQIVVQLAILNQEKGDHQAAVLLLEDASSKHHDVPEVFLNLGFSQQAVGENSAAERSFNTFMKMTRGRALYETQRQVVKEWLTYFDALRT